MIEDYEGLEGLVLRNLVGMPGSAHHMGTVSPVLESWNLKPRCLYMIFFVYPLHLTYVVIRSLRMAPSPALIAQL
jgi:hypothetical protein